MIARGVTLDQLQTAAQEVGVRLYGGSYGPGAVERSTRKGPEFRFTLRTGEKEERRLDWRGKLRWAAKYQRLSTHARRSHAKGDTYGDIYYPVVPGAVCFHGHRDFFRALYRLAPHAWIKTAMAIYTSAEQFEATYRNAAAPEGNLYGFQPYKQACSCREGAD